MNKQAQIPVPLRMALGVLGGQLMLQESRRRIGELEAQAELLNAMARRAEFERSAATIMALRHTQAPVILGRGGVHPAFGYEVPVGMDQGMVRMAAVEMGRGMAREEAAFRKQALSMGSKVGLGATAGLIGLGGLGVAAGKGLKVADKYEARAPYRGQVIPQVKLGQALVEFHEGMDKEALGFPKALFTAAKGGLLKGRKAFTAASGEGVLSAGRKALSAGTAQAGRTFEAARAFTPARAVTSPRSGATALESRRAIKPSSPGQITPPGGASGATTGTPPPPKSTQANASTQAVPTPGVEGAAGVATQEAGPGAEMLEGAKRWGQKWVVNPTKWAIKHPTASLAMGVGVPAAAYGAYRLGTAGIDVMQQHNPQYTYNMGGFQVPTQVGQYGYTEAPALRY